MGLLDKIKPHTPPIRPADLGIDEARGLTVRWEDGKTTVFAPVWLRARCPCAGCVEEWTGKRTVGEAQVDQTVKAKGMSAIGNYAVQLEWSDGHQTGIYSWDYLLKLRRELEGIPA
jgi:DUF971 family protein